MVDEVDDGSVEENEEGEKDVVEEGEAEEVSVHTKLYFGNLPYSVDSAELAAIIQDYGSPELIEVLIMDLLFELEIGIASVNSFDGFSVLIW